MTPPLHPTPLVAIACGGTGGHLFPGVAVAGQLARRGCVVTLLVSPKEVDRQAVQGVNGVEVVTLPAVAWQRGSRFAFLRGFCQSWGASRKLFRVRRPHAVLAMGGFTGAPPILAAKALGARTFLHESNTIPGRANRWLARLADHAFVGFPEAALRLPTRKTTLTGTPVRPAFQPRDPAVCRVALELDAARPVVLVMGGSQGASGINQRILAALPLLAKRFPDWQWLHLTGPDEVTQVRQAYAALGLKAAVHPFLARMELALGAATAAVSRAGASSLAELAAMRLPPLLVPFPFAADNHQWHNARAFADTGAARVLEQRHATPEELAGRLAELVGDAAVREPMRAALGRWHAPQAAGQIADAILQAIAQESEGIAGESRGSPRVDRAGQQHAEQRAADDKAVLRTEVAA